MHNSLQINKTLFQTAEDGLIGGENHPPNLADGQNTVASIPSRPEGNPKKSPQMLRICGPFPEKAIRL